MAKQELGAMRERGEAYASLALTGHICYSGPGLRRNRHGHRSFEILKEGEASGRFFCVQLANCMDLPSIQDADKFVLTHTGKDPFDLELPICVFVIGVRKPEGIYLWVIEPVI